MDEKDLMRVEAHLKRTFGNPHVKVLARQQEGLGRGGSSKAEFIGVVYEDEDEAGSFLFEMAILAEDLDA